MRPLRTCTAVRYRGTMRTAHVQAFISKMMTDFTAPNIAECFFSQDLLNFLKFHSQSLTLSNLVDRKAGLENEQRGPQTTLRRLHSRPTYIGLQVLLAYGSQRLD